MAPSLRCDWDLLVIGAEAVVEETRSEITGGGSASEDVVSGKVGVGETTLDVSGAGKEDVGPGLGTVRIEVEVGIGVGALIRPVEGAVG